MLTQSKLLILVLSGVLAFLIGPDKDALAVIEDVAVLEMKLVVRTDSPEYSLGDEVVIFGTIANDILTPGQPVVLFVHDPLGAIVRSDLVIPYSNGSFWYEMPTGGELMRYSGGYKIVANYAEQYRAETTFDFSGSDAGEDGNCIVFGCIYELHVGNKTFEINYRISGSIQNMTLNVEANTLEIEALVISKTYPLQILLPRELIDATEPDVDGSLRDGNFTVLINGLNQEHVIEREPLDLPDDRDLTIEMLQDGENRVEIVGTRVIPEFVSPAMTILATTVAGLILWTRGKVRKKDYAR